MDILFLWLAALLLAVDFALNKIYEGRFGSDPAGSLTFNCFLGLFSFFFFFLLGGGRFPVTPFSLGLAALLSLCVMGYHIIGFRLLAGGTVATYTTALMAGGMLLPYLFGVAFLGEAFSFLRAIAVGLILLGVLFTSPPVRREKAGVLLLLFAVFLLNGAVSILSKVHQVQTVYPAVDATAFVALSGGVKCLFSAAALPFFLRRRARYAGRAGAPAETEVPRDTSAPGGAPAERGSLPPVAAGANNRRRARALALLLIAASALVGGLSYLLQLRGAATLPASLLYPFVTGGSILFSALLGWLLFREKPTRRTLLGLLFCFGGTLLFL